MKNKSDAHVDMTVLLGLLRGLAAQGMIQVRAAVLARESRATGHYVAKKFVRRRLSVCGDGVTGVEGVRISEGPRGRFWFALDTPGIDSPQLAAD